MSMVLPDVGNARWRKSIRSEPSEHCVEVASVASVVAVRDSKNVEGPELVFTRTMWRTFTGRVRAGRFDL